ncbi:MAG: dihydroorotate dehydrogenase electron transfer subunit [Candidatus Omnitrophica bacterium]|nr:dihydroorotate dehydrogenase electron transfer subunit [Candidatus Omnitrophota bacterium]
MIQEKAEILLNQNIALDHYKLVVKVDGLKDAIKPGQFFHIKAGTEYDPLLRRPLSVHRIGSKPNIIEFLYKVVGKGTHLISRRSKGTYLDVIGPIGNGFKVPKSQSNFVLIAGGMGVAPLVALAETLAGFRKRSITAIVGAKTKSCLTCNKELKELGAKLIVVTEDGSAGEKGFATSALTDIIEQFDLRKTDSPHVKKDAGHLTIGDYRPEVGLYACGPIPMLKAVSKIARKYRIQVQASMEERMGCGVGACLGCAVKTKRGYEMVCKDGPVFDLEDIVWE